MRMRNKIVAVAAIAMGIVTVPSIAEAHNATFSADCEGVVVNAVRYNPDAENQWTVTIDGVTQTGVFGSSYQNTFPVPQSGATTAWSASVDAPGTRYDRSASGTVGPCGEIPPPPPPPIVPPSPPENPPGPKHARTKVTVVDKCNCYRDNVKMTGGKHVTIKKRHPSKTLWVFTVTADEGYMLPKRIGGNSGWAATQVYKVRTTNKPCPCKQRGDCHELYPNYTPPTNPCRGKEC